MLLSTLLFLCIYRNKIYLFDICRNLAIQIHCPSRKQNFLTSTKGVREPEISDRVGNTKFFQVRDENRKISRFSKESGFGRGLGTSLNNSLKPTSSTVSKGRRSRTIVRAIPSVDLTIFRISFCTRDKFYIRFSFVSSTYTNVWMRMLQMA